MKEVNGMKYCPKCKQTQPVSEYHLNLSSTDGYQTWCKSCNRAFIEANRARNRAKNLAKRAGQQ